MEAGINVVNFISGHGKAKMNQVKSCTSVCSKSVFVNIDLNTEHYQPYRLIHISSYNILIDKNSSCARYLPIAHHLIYTIHLPLTFRTLAFHTFRYPLKCVPAALAGAHFTRHFNN